MPYRDTITAAFLSAPMPEKYNDHNIAGRIFDPSSLNATKEDKAAFEEASGLADESADGSTAKKKGGLGKFVRAAAGAALASTAGTESSTIIDDADKDEYAVLSHKYLLEQRVAKQLFDKWFIDEGGNFSMSLVQERGLYDASMSDVQTAKNSALGMGLLADAGEELINNTFVVVSRYRYMSKDDLVAEIEAAASAIGSAIGGYGDLASSISSTAVKASLGAGYYVRATSFLFQLRWNEEISNTFYQSLWDNKQAYDSSDIFELKYIGQESAFANVKAGIFSNKEEGELIRIATVNATDAVIAKLQKKYDVFKTKTPLLTTKPLTAHIGMKEGVEPGDKFEVLEQIVDPETNKTTYKRKATITAKKGRIWDNRYMANEEREATGEESDLTATEFEGKDSGLYPGMLLRQIK